MAKVPGTYTEKPEPEAGMSALHEMPAKMSVTTFVPARAGVEFSPESDLVTLTFFGQDPEIVRMVIPNSAWDEMREQSMAKASIVMPGGLVTP